MFTSVVLILSKKLSQYVCLPNGMGYCEITSTILLKIYEIKLIHNWSVAAA